MLAYSYLRFSTIEQRDGDSIRRQDSRYRELCDRHKLTPAVRYFDEGKSAYRGNKQRGLEQFLSLVKAGEIAVGSWLCIESFDRISRKGFRPTQRILEQILDNGIIVATANPERILDKKSLDDPMAIIELLFIATRAKEESDRKSERVREAWANKLAHAKTKVVTAKGPSWLRLVNGKWEPIAERVKVIRQIFKWASVNGLGQRAITKRLNTRGIPPFKTHRANGNRWGWAFVRLILTDRKVIGDFTTKAGIVKGYYPAVIDNPTFLKVQALTKKRLRFRGATSQTVSNLFTGLAFNEDNSSMVYVKKGADVPARFIPSKFETTNGKGAVSFPYAIFEQEMLNVIDGLTLADIGKAERRPSKETAKVEAALSKLDSHIADAQEALGNLDESPTEAVKVLSELGLRKKSLVAQLESLRAEQHLVTPADSLGEAKTILECLQSTKGDDNIEMRLRLREALRGLISRIDCKLIRDGWRTQIGCIIRFQSGHHKRVVMVVVRGQLETLWADCEKWTDEEPADVVYFKGVELPLFTIEQLVEMQERELSAN